MFVRNVVLALAALALAAEPSLSFLAPSASFSRGTRLQMSGDAVPDLDPERTGVVLIEYQNEFTTEGGKLHDAVKECMDKTNMLENSKKLVDEARASGCKIFHVPINFEKGHREISTTPYGVLAGVKDGEAFTNNEWGGDFCEAMRPASDDIIVKGKSGLCGFHSTNLDFVLRQNDIKNVLIGGFLTNCCVESTMRTAYEHGYKVYTLTDCAAATSVEAHENAIKHDFGMFSVPVTSEEAIGMLQAPATISAA